MALKDQDILGMLNNVPGFERKLVSTFDRYETLHIEKGSYAKDMFGMGPEYDTNISFYRRLIEDSFGGQSRQASNYKKLSESLSDTNQLVMENNYMDPISYFTMTENVRKSLDELNVNVAAQKGLEGNDAVNLSAHDLSHSNRLLVGTGEGVSIKPMAMLSGYRLSMLRNFLKQGIEIKKNQKRESETWEDAFEISKKAGHCTPGP